MFEPSERTLWLVVLVAAVGALGLAVPAVGDAAPFLAVGVALAVIADSVLAGSPRAVMVRRVLPAHVVEHRSAELRLELSAARTLEIDVVDSLPVHALAAGAPHQAHHHLRLDAGTTVQVTTLATFARRGRHALGRVALRSRGPLGLVRRRARVRVPSDVDVLPDLARITERAERMLRGQGGEGHRRRTWDEGRELDALRDYQRGDDPRLIAWKTSARRGDLVVKKMRPEARQDIMVAVDVGRHMSGAHAVEDGGELRVEVAVTTALVLAAAALARGDRAGMVAFADDVLAFERPLEGRAHLRRLSGAVHAVEARAVESDYGALVNFLLARHKRRCMLVFITDVLDEPSARALAAAVARVRGRHLPVVLALADPGLPRLARAPTAPSSAPAPQPVSASDLSEVDTLAALVPEAAERLQRHRRQALSALESAGAVVVDAPASRAAAQLVERYAGMKARGRL